MSPTLNLHGLAQTKATNVRYCSVCGAVQKVNIQLMSTNYPPAGWLKGQTLYWGRKYGWRHATRPRLCLLYSPRDRAAEPKARGIQCRCNQITLPVKHFYTNLERCEVLTGYLSLGRRSGGDWADTWHWTERFRQRPHRALRYVCYVRYTKWPHWLRFVRDSREK